MRNYIRLCGKYKENFSNYKLEKGIKLKMLAVVQVILSKSRMSTEDSFIYKSSQNNDLRFLF